MARNAYLAFDDGNAKPDICKKMVELPYLRFLLPFPLYAFCNLCKRTCQFRNGNIASKITPLRSSLGWSNSWASNIEGNEHGIRTKRSTFPSKFLAHEVSLLLELYGCGEVVQELLPELRRSTIQNSTMFETNIFLGRRAHSRDAPRTPRDINIDLEAHRAELEKDAY